MNLGNVMLSEEARHTGPHIIWFHTYGMSGIGKSIETESGLMVARGWRWGERRATANGYGISFWGHESILTLASGSG